MSLEQFEATAPLLDTEHPSLIMPHFLQPVADYCQRLDAIAEDNGLADWLAHETPCTSLACRPTAVPLYTPTPSSQAWGAAHRTCGDSGTRQEETGEEEGDEDEEIEEGMAIGGDARIWNRME